jgi:hypothetical protein
MPAQKKMRILKKSEKWKSVHFLLKICFQNRLCLLTGISQRRNFKQFLRIELFGCEILHNDLDQDNWKIF